jgi:hypothetical protein
VVKTAHLSAAHAALPGELLVWAREQDLGDDDPLFFSQQRTAGGRRKAIDRVRAWQIVKSASGAGGGPGVGFADDRLWPHR